MLLDTVRHLLALEDSADEILIVDQTLNHEAPTTLQLDEWHAAGKIRLLKLEQPSIPRAMNAGLAAAHSEVVLFLDDDIIPTLQLVSEHRRAHTEYPEVAAVVGQVIQPWQQPTEVAPPRQLAGLRRDFDFPFHSTRHADVANVMAGNLSVKRRAALLVGGFDENFVGAAYRFETEFARRLVRAGEEIRFCGTAGIQHLRISSGGTRSAGDHRMSADPRHGVGDYYYALGDGISLEVLTYCVGRMLREVCTRFHLSRPWYIPVKLIGEARAMLWAWNMRSAGPRLLKPEEKAAGRA